MEKKYACICKSCALKCCQDFLINADTGISNLRHVMERIGQLDFDVVIVEHFFSAPEWKHLYLSSDTTVIVFDNKRTSLDVLFGIEASVLDKMLARGQLKSISSNTMNIDKFSISEVNSNNHYATPLNIFGRRCLLKA